MASFLPPQAECDPIRNILEWQSQQLQVQPSEYVEEADHSVIASLSASLLSLFKGIILALAEQKETEIPQAARISLERSCGALILWSEGFGIADGRLNDTFNRSRKLRYTTLKNLLHIGRVLVERLVPLVHVSKKLLVSLSRVESNIEEADVILAESSSRQSDDSSSDAASDFSNDDIHEIAEDLKTDTLILSSLDPLLKYPIFDPQHQDAADGHTVSTWSPEKLFSDKIGNRFPSAATPLASHLGRANYERYLRCQATRDAQEGQEALPVTNQDGQDHAGTIIADSRFHDSGVGTSLGASLALTVSYAETTMSYNHEGQSVRIPPLSKEAKAGCPFSCVACGRTVVITNNSEWKRHIYLDLQPYMCLDMSCPYSNTTFESRDKWIAHLALDHEMEPRWESTQCALCKEQTGSGKMAVTMHLSKHLEEISLSALPVEIASNAASEDTSELTDVSFFGEFDYGGSNGHRGPLSPGIDETKTENGHNVQGSHDFDTPNLNTKTRNLPAPWEVQRLRSAAAQGDIQTVVRILRANDSFDDPEATVAAAREGWYMVLQVLLNFGANPDPFPVSRTEFATPMLAAIGQRNIKVVELLLAQKKFNPRRTFKGERYHEIAHRRRGPNWELEELKLKSAYNDYKEIPISLVEENSPDTGAKAVHSHSKDSYATEGHPRRHSDPHIASVPHISSANEEPISQAPSQEMLEANLGSYKCPFCDMSFTGIADRHRHTHAQHIEKAKDYHDFLATVKAQFKDQPDKYTRFLNILAVILRGPCGRCLSQLIRCDAKFPSPCSACHSGQFPCVVIARTTPRRFIKHLDVYQVVSNIGQLFEGYPSFVTQELGSLLPPEYRIEAIDHSSVRFFAPNTDPVIVKAVKSNQPEDSQRQRTSEHSAVDANNTPKPHMEYVELKRVELSESWVTKVKERFIASPHVYRQLLEILRDTQDDTRSIQDAYSAAKKLFGVNRDLIDEFQILIAKGELKLDEFLLQRTRSVSKFGSERSDQAHLDSAESQGSKEDPEVVNKGKSSDEAQLLCYICHEAGGDMIQCGNTDGCQGWWFHLVCVGLSTAPAATAKWHCPYCRSRIAIEGETDASPGGSDKGRSTPSIGRINYPQPNPDIYIWPPDSYDALEALPEQASSSDVPPPLSPPDLVENHDTVEDENARPDLWPKISPPRVPRTSVVPPVPSRLREVTTYAADVQLPSHDPSARTSEDPQPAVAEPDAH